MSDLAIETNQLTKRFGNVLAVKAVDLRVKQGELYGFLGLNGAGKTTTIRALLGMIRPSEGNIRVLGQAVDNLVDLPSWTNRLAMQFFGDILATAGMAPLLMTLVAFIASMGRGYLPPLGWAVLTIFFSQIIAAMGWGDWFPWSVPALYSEVIGPRAEQLGIHSYVLVILSCLAGLVATFWWWRNADQTR